MNAWNLCCCFLLILISSSAVSDGFMIQKNYEYIHKFLLSDNTTNSDEFTFFFKKPLNCKITSKTTIKFSIGSAKTGSSLTKFSISVNPDVNENIYFEVETTDTNNGIISARGLGKEFLVTLKSESLIEIVVDGKLKKSTEKIHDFLKFDAINQTHLGIIFYAWFDDSKNLNGCPFIFEFPNYGELKEMVRSPPTPKALPSPEVTPSEIAASSTSTKSPSESGSESNSASIWIYLGAGFGSLILGIIVSGIASYFVFRNFSYFKPPTSEAEVAATKADVERTKFENSTAKTTMTTNQDDKRATQTTVSKTDANTKNKTLNGIPNIESYGGKTNAQ